MDTAAVLRIIDKNINESLFKGLSFSDIHDQLYAKIKKFSDNVNRDHPEHDICSLLAQDIDTVGPTRLRYQILYIKGCSRRIIDIYWLINNRDNFSNMDDHTVFSLLKLRETLSINNSKFVSAPKSLPEVVVWD